MRYAILLFLLSGCGGSYDVNVNDVEVTHHIELSQIEQYMLTYCQSQYTDVIDISQCVDIEMAKFIRVIN